MSKKSYVSQSLGCKIHRHQFLVRKNWYFWKLYVVCKVMHTDNDRQDIVQLLSSANLEGLIYISKMKRIFIPALLLGLTFAGCQNKTDKMDHFDHEETPALTNDSTDAASDTEVDETAELDASDYDAQLDAYESYIDTYISLLNKSKSGHELSAMKAYLAYMKKAQDLSSELDQHEGDMNSEQQKRFADLKDKFAKSLMTI